MGRKVFISFLGTGYYSKAKYYLDSKDNLVETNFIQEATLKFFTKDWHAPDIAYFFLTEKAKSTNWDSPAQKDDCKVKIGERGTYDGLEERIKKLGIGFLYTPIDIPDGHNEEQIWEIFDKVYNVLQEGDKLYFDITHAFRSLPMLVMVLINYAKFLKKITVKSITYGNFESRAAQNVAPIIDITSFSELQDWTSAAASFIKYGRTSDISSLVADQELKNDLLSFSDMHLVVRAKEVYKGEIAEKLKSQIDQNESNPAFRHIKKIIKNKLSAYNDDMINNALAGIKFCIDHDLIQQGFTFLDEFLKTYVLLLIDKNWEKEMFRNIASSCLNINNKDSLDYSRYDDKINKDFNDGKISGEEKENLLNEIRDIVDKIFGLSIIEDLQKIMRSVSHGSRNDINHAGIRDNPRKAIDFKKSLSKHYNRLKEIVENNNVSSS